jgi:uncharacterized protein (TIGR02300 family)
VVSPELGTKRICPSCAARFYDLNKNPAVCPKCATAFVAESLLPSKGEAALAPKPPRPVAEPNDLEEVADVELVSLDEVDDGTDDVDDETAGIEDVDLGEDVAGDAGEEDVFLEEEEDDDNVSGIIGGSKDDDEGL